MPVGTVRMRTGDLVNPYNVVMYPALAIVGIARNGAGVGIPDVVCKCFKTASDIKFDTQTSDINGGYVFPISDRKNYYVTGVLDTEFHADSLIVTADSQFYSADMAQLDAITVNTLVGA